MSYLSPRTSKTVSTWDLAFRISVIRNYWVQTYRLQSKILKHVICPFTYMYTRKFEFSLLLGTPLTDSNPTFVCSKIGTNFLSVRLSCGQTIKQNLSYFILEETQAPQPSPCSYTICPVASNVNRIRLDFTVITSEISDL